MTHDSMDTARLAGERAARKAAEQNAALDRLVDHGVDSARLAGERARAATCQWFARCGRPATGTTPHPAFPGGVPTCDRCHEFGTGDKR